MKNSLSLFLLCLALCSFAEDDDFSCTVESIRYMSVSSTNHCRSVIDFEVQCVISNKTPFDVEMTRFYVDDLFNGEYIYANGEKGDAVRMTAGRRSWEPNPKKWKYYTLKSNGCCRVKTAIIVNDSTGLYRRLPTVQWQMLDTECVMRGWKRIGDEAPCHSKEDATDFLVEVSFPKVLPLESMGAFPRKWRDPETGIEWTYRVFRNEVILGGGDGWETAIEKTTTGAIDIPSMIDGMPVVSIGNAAFMLCEVESISVPSSVRSIGYSAFEQCWALKELSISSNVTDIAESAFKCCDDLVIRRY